MRYLSALLLLFAVSSLQAQEAPPPGTTVTISGSTTLRWQPPTENVDGTAIVGPLTYRIHMGRSSRTYVTTVDVTAPDATNWGFSIPIVDEDDIDWYIAMTAVDGDGDESTFSNEVRHTLAVVFEGDDTPLPPVMETDLNSTFTCVTDNAVWTCTVTTTTTVTIP